ncbi:CoA transferase [Nonomuraea sp. NPDC050404]|uniref:CoA transferase n=1 Tax=Nonomuraea sp. NPDC050404 TaxID=3155783 RepID=UPI0033F4F060
MDVNPNARLITPGRVTVARPLSGAGVLALGDSQALLVAAARLRALGCAVTRGTGSPPAGAPAGWLGVTRVPYGAGTGGALPECGIGWSGPVDVLMGGERDVQAACGIMHVHGRATGGPRALRLDYASMCAGVLAAQAVTAGVLALLRGGPALAASTSVAQAALLSVGQYVATATATGRDWDGRAAIGMPNGMRQDPPFRSADGVWFEIETFDAENWRRFWTALGAGLAAIGAGWPPFQQRFATAACVLPASLGATASALAYENLTVAARATGVSILPVRQEITRLAIPASPWRLRDLRTGDLTPARPPFDLNAAPTRPPLDPGTAPTLPPLGPGARGPLSGLRVVEATNRIQGPLAGHLLRLLGADVVRIEPPGGDPMRGVPPMAGGCSARFQALNRDKRAVEADLKSPEGRREARRLIAGAEVFLQNWPPGRAARLGLEPADLAAVHPSLVHAHAGGWADVLPEPQPMGTDYLVQAYSGVGALLTAPGEPPAPSLMTLTDVLGALISAEGVVAALLARALTGAGVRSETALIDAAALMCDTTSIEEGPWRIGQAGAVHDLAVMAADPAFSAVFDTDGDATYCGAPWSFVPVTVRQCEEAA